ncbi:MAG: class A beta-lactamase, subclass A2 [Cytophagales bacterium]|nr:class A beta-lactamase, subclass A2 [Cytophagales bacterium]
MIKKITFTFLFGLFVLAKVEAQDINTLKQAINEVIDGKSATVGVAIWGNKPEDKISVNGSKHLPMQSVYKFHLALAVLHQVDQGKLSLDQEISIDKSFMETYQHLWSPLRKKFPDGVEISLAEVVRYTVAWSDNVGCDVLFELVGGTEVVHDYIHSLGVKDIAIKYPEIVMQDKWHIQYENWTTVDAANQLLQIFHENKGNTWSDESHQFLLQILKDTQTGKKRIRGFLPASTVVAHKTGYSGKNEEGLSGAVNNIGIVFLPDGTYFYISVFVSDSMETDDTNQEIIARIAKLAWDYFND